MNITIFTDPTCPFAYSAEPIRWRLKWLYDDQLEWDTRMIVLSGYNGETSPITPEQISMFRTKMREQYGMPMSDTVPPRVPDSILACTAFKAAKINAPENADSLLRFLRIATMGGEMIDEQAIIDTATKKADIDANELQKWMQGEKTQQQLKEDAEAARNPGFAALNMRRKLSKTSTDRVRYPAPSYIFSIDSHIVFELPGFWPLEAYKAALGNFLPNAERTDNPKSVGEVLEWAKTPLATKEVAVICEKDIEEVRKELEEIATFEPVGQDGFWTLK